MTDAGPRAQPLTQEPVAAPAMRRVWAPAALALMAVGWGGNQFTPLVGPYEYLLGLDQLTVNLVFFSYVAGIVPALFLAARLQRRLSLRALVVVAVLLSVAGSVLLATAGARIELLIAGRVLTGVALGSGMVNGGAWARRLVVAQGGFTSASLAAAARVTALSLTTGFGLGALAAGLLAWAAPAPLTSAYVPHMLLGLATLAVIGTTRRHTAVAATPHPATASTPGGQAGLGTLLLAVLPVAPFIFGALGTAYAVLPQRLAESHGPVSVLYLTLLATTALTSGFVIQQVARRVRRPLRFPGPTLGMAAFIVTLGVVAARLPHLGAVEVWAMSALLGVAYGLVISGLLMRVQLASPPHAEAQMTALLYTFAYAGFGLPPALSWASTWADWSTLLYGVAALAVLLTIIAHLAGRRLHPHRSDDHGPEPGRATP